VDPGTAATAEADASAHERDGAGEGSDDPADRPGRRLSLRPGRALVILLATAFLVLLGYGLVSKADDDGIDQALVRGLAAPAPAFELSVLGRGSGPMPPRATGALADGRLGLGELRGTPVVVNFWASWCPPCRSEQPALERSWRAERGRGDVLFLGIDQQDLTPDARAWIDEFRVTYPQVRDPSDRTARSYGATGLPETYFIDARGLVVGHVIGEITPGQLTAGVEAARSGRLLGSRAGGERRTSN